MNSDDLGRYTEVIATISIIPKSLHMQILKIALLLLCNQVIAQDFIETIDGKKINVVEGSIKVEPASKRLSYSIPNEEKRGKIKYKVLSKAVYKDNVIQTFDVDGKRRAFFILANSDGKKLGVLPTKRSVSKGGFEVPYKRYEFVIADKNDKVLESLVFTDVNSPQHISLRNQASELIIQHFADCPNLIERLKTFENSATNVRNGQVLEMLDNPYHISCK